MLLLFLFSLVVRDAQALNNLGWTTSKRQKWLFKTATNNTKLRNGLLWSLSEMLFWYASYKIRIQNISQRTGVLWIAVGIILNNPKAAATMWIWRVSPCLTPIHTLCAATKKGKDQIGCWQKKVSFKKKKSKLLSISQWKWVV